MEDWRAQIVVGHTVGIIDWKTLEIVGHTVSRVVIDLRMCKIVGCSIGMQI
jgi:hypothetical protein